ncbi:WhiB family transcriptional regulator [Actinopolymorpha pittospori]|uniref:4Fe-4S Wbl-type domain-containing protein n=1 Tax=Actinopolymorpha pittospori TaxID=648752 RepID=A0A927RKY6_9ACTN|nr:WhiB family transcriptional regulator [Actinopolymorpha pittospori]MBE1608701.1 hypothetical protein [Actinopolymorpha pittospori]
MTSIDADRLMEAAKLSSPALRERTQRDGLCSKDQDRADEWFPPQPPETSSGARAHYEHTARALCTPCPVRAECLEFALRQEAGQRAWGIWGGLAPWQREPLVKARRRHDTAHDLASTTIRALSQAA